MKVGLSIPRSPAERPRGVNLLNHPALNKGTAFTERRADPVRPARPAAAAGRDPGRAGGPRVPGVPAQGRRPRATHLSARPAGHQRGALLPAPPRPHRGDDADRLHARGRVACEQFSHIYRRPRGLFIPYPLRDSIPKLLRNRPNPEVDVIVVTDGERILGIGDQGAGGMGIPIGKLSLYTLIGGIRPERTLPIVLDVGTNNPERLHDPEYLGWRHERVAGQAYFDFVDQFVPAVQQELPTRCLQWEDFATPHARPDPGALPRRAADLQRRHPGNRGRCPGRDPGGGRRDGQAAPRPADRLPRRRLGRPSAWPITCARRWCEDGLSEAEARGRFWLVDKDGLLHAGRTDLDARAARIRPAGRSRGRVAADLSRHDRPGGRDRPDRRDHSDRPLDRRRRVHRADRPRDGPQGPAAGDLPAVEPHDPFRGDRRGPDPLDDGRALVATGSPYPPVQYEGRTIPIAQCNNVFIFPAVGLGVVASRARRVTDGMMLAAARALGEHSPARTDPCGSLLPALRDVRAVTRAIATAVGLERSGPGSRLRRAPKNSATGSQPRSDAGVPADDARKKNVK